MEEQIKLEHLFRPIKIKSMELKNRIVMSPMGTLMASEDGSPSDRLHHGGGCRSSSLHRLWYG